MTSIADNLARLHERIAAAERRYGRTPGSVRLIAVSKTRPAADLRAALAAGQHAFGESYAREALDKIEALAGEAVEWHFIGPVQSNKTKPIAERFDWVHSVDRLKVARRLGEQRPPASAPLQICLQVNISGEPTKSGIGPSELAGLAAEVRTLPGVTLRGLMAIPAPGRDLDALRRPYRALRAAFDELRAHAPEMDTLSMGMTGDLEAAIAEGSTMVRIGTAIFGSRPDALGAGTGVG